MVQDRIVLLWLPAVLVELCLPAVLVELSSLLVIC